MAAWLLILCLTRCGGGEPSDRVGGGELGADSKSDGAVPAVGEVSFARDVLPIFRRSCSTGYCHPGGYSPMSLTEGAAHGALVGVAAVGCGDGRMRVTPGSARASDSDLLARLTGTDLCEDASVMPMGGRLSAEEIELVRAWIVQGARND